MSATLLAWTRGASLMEDNSGAKNEAAVKRVAQLVNDALQRRDGVTMNQIALYSGVNVGYLSRIRRGKLSSPPSPDVLRRLAPHLKVPYEELLRAAGYIENVDRVPQDLHIFLRAKDELPPEEFRELVNFAMWKLQQHRNGPPEA